MPTLIRITTVPISLKLLLTGQMLFMKQKGFEVISISNDGNEIDDIKKKEQCEHYAVNLTRQITPIADIQALYTLYKIFKKIKPDIVHTHTPKAGLIGMWAAFLAGVKVKIHTVAGLPLQTTYGNKRKLLTLIEKLTYWPANEVWVNSGSLLQFVKQNLNNGDKVKMIGKGSSNGIDLSQFSYDIPENEEILSFKNKINFDQPVKYILAVGRVVRDKGINEIVKVFSQICEVENVKLILLGPFESERTEEKLDEFTINQIQNNPKIHHVPWSDNVAQYMKIAAVLVHASYREGFPNVLLQAGAMKLPIVCSNIEGNIDIVKDNETGYIFEVKNEMQLKNKLLESLHDDQRNQYLSENLYNIIMENYERNAFHELIFNEYNRLLSNV